MKKSDKLSIRFNGQEVYDTGKGSKGKKHLHTLGVKNGYNIDFIIDCGKISAEEIKEKNEGIPLGSAAEAQTDEDDDDINEQLDGEDEQLDDEDEPSSGETAE